MYPHLSKDSKTNNSQNRIEDQPKETDQVRSFLCKHPFQVHISNRHTNDQHTCRTYHLSKTADTRCYHTRKLHAKQKEQQSQKHRNDIRIEQNLFPILLSTLTDQTRTMCPHQNRLNKNKCGCVKYPFTSKHCADQRNDKISCICINDRCFLDTVKMKDMIQNPCPCQHDNMDKDCCYNSKQQSSHLIIRHLYLKRINNNTRRTNIYYQIGNHFSVRFLKKPNLDNKKSYRHCKKHCKYLFCQ